MLFVEGINLWGKDLGIQRINIIAAPPIYMVGY